jgi:surface antigen
MGTIKQHFISLIDYLKINLGQSNRKLLLAAVILFGLTCALINPVKGAEGLLSLYFNKDKSSIVEQPQNEIPCLPEFFFNTGTYLAANTLASLTNQSDSANNSQENSFLNEANLSTLQQNALLSQTNPTTFISQEPRLETITYLVQEGDTPSSIAASFGITLNTLLWANKLKEASIIRPGDELIILPVSGVLHRVKSGETVGSIATRYKASTEKIIAFNELPADGSIQIGQKLIIPDGQMPIFKSKPTRIVRRTYTTGPGTGKSRHFPYGQCTWYVAQKRVVPWSGHAKSWLANAQAYGYQTGSVPRAGAIMVLSEGGWLGRRYGHVAYVEAVKGSWVTISEMNYNCYACRSVRTLNINDRRIRGYIY